MPSRTKHPHRAPAPAPAAVRRSDGRCACGDASQDPFLEWVSRLVREHRTHLHGVARREGLRPEEAFDAVQDAFQTFLALPEARALVEAREDSRRLLVVLTRNVARNRRRLHALARPHDGDAVLVASLPQDGSSVEELVAAAEEGVRLHGCVQTLADAQRAVVTLRMLEEESGEDVARRLGITPGHVAVLLHRAKASLLACMTAPPRHSAPPLASTGS